MILALTGKKQSGKTVIADYLVDKGFVKINFKDALIKELKQNFNKLLNDMGELYGLTISDLFVEKPTLMRDLMQEYGTEVRRGDKDSYWTDKWRQAVNEEMNEDIVVDDCRFINEAQAVKDYGGIIIRIDRPTLKDDGDTHASEVEMKNIVEDHILINDGTKQDLLNKLYMLLLEEGYNLK